MDYIIYHQVKPGINCPDGIAAAWVAAKALPDAKVIGWSYQTPPPDFLQPGDRVTIVDFSFSAPITAKWLNEGVEVLVIDHHKTAQESLGDLNSLSESFTNPEPKFKALFNINECGATLTWRHFFPHATMPVFLRYIKDRDLWQFNHPETRAIHEAMASIGRSFELFDKLAPMTKMELLDYLLPIGNDLLREKRHQCLEAAKRVKFSSFSFNPPRIKILEPGFPLIWATIKGMARGVAGILLGKTQAPDFIPTVQLSPGEERLTSDICEILYSEKFPNAPFVMAVMADGSTCSLRSNQYGSNYDVSSLARQFGGGGHRNAAGFKYLGK